MAYRHATFLAAAVAAIGGLATAASADVGTMPVETGVSDGLATMAVADLHSPFDTMMANRPAARMPMSTIDFFAVSRKSLEQAQPHVLGTGLWAAPGWRSGAKMRLIASPALGDGALVVGFGAGADRRRALGQPNSLWRTGNGGTRRFELGWLSGDGWRLSGGYTAATGGARLSGSRLLDLAHGAHPRESGAHMTLAFADAGRKISYGITGGSGQLSRGDALDLGRGADRHDTNASLFWLARF